MSICWSKSWLLAEKLLMLFVRIVAVGSKSIRFAFLHGAAFGLARQRHKTRRVIIITIWSATPRSLCVSVSRPGSQIARLCCTVLTMFRVSKAYTLMRPWKYPKRMETGKYLMSLGLRRNRPISLTTLVKANMNTNWDQNAYWRDSVVQSAVPHQRESRRRGSTRNASEVKVAMCRAYVHHGC